MDKRPKQVDEGKDRFELDVDRMINEGMAGGRPQSAYGHEQIGEDHPIPEQKADQK
ncbi:hypothetical protein GCM10010954_13470 [Halobacillus andaensis]|uniref:Uncharacterized protein n=1 Tax=Halobacillus andaensis TaxID=1176239 RepID=A0A917B223_HALAA|nr:hypothetical protein [Halobacillus andaensis]MBP2004148.1 hypothetical protein [Halobacillus andaensis]GGF16149.1 hypothetical protein GCM10010954_13470 [Halobacillus andaensis]